MATQIKRDKSESQNLTKTNNSIFLHLSSPQEVSNIITVKG